MSAGSKHQIDWNWSSSKMVPSWHQDSYVEFSPWICLWVLLILVYGIKRFNYFDLTNFSSFCTWNFSNNSHPLWMEHKRKFFKISLCNFGIPPFPSSSLDIQILTFFLHLTFESYFFYFFIFFKTWTVNLFEFFLFFYFPFFPFPFFFFRAYWLWDGYLMEF